jgi:hypothetical protein
MVKRFIGHAVLIFTTIAWDKDGHDAVGGTAMSLLDSAASSKLKGILGGEDASDVAGWAHKIEQSLGWTAGTHFHPQEADWSCSPASTGSQDACKDGRCLETAIRHFFRQLTRGDSVQGVNVMKDDADFTDADAMRFIINLVGDASQALHVGFKSNNFGRNVYVKLPENLPRGAGEVVSLYDLWDSKISQNIINNPYNPNFWYSGWTHVRNLPHTTVEREKKLWNEKGIEAVHYWLKESAEYACNNIYTDPATSQRFVLSADPKNPTEISFMTYRLWEQAVRERILLGGLRLGLLVNAILLNPDAPSAAKLRRGSAVNDVDTKESILQNVFDDLDERADNKPNATKSKPRAILGINAGLLNLGLFAAFAIVMLLIAKCGGGINPTSIKVAKSNLVEMVGPQSRKVLNEHRD